MLRAVTSLPLPGSLHLRLRETGFVYYEDLCDGYGPEGNKLVKQWGIDEQLKRLASVPPTKSALDIWQEECTSPHIVTFSKAVDDLLDGGIVVGEITELCGAPGSGKTQMSLQVCVDVQIPRSFGGLEGEALFIDTSSGFTPARLKEMAEACVDHCQLVAFHQDQEDMGQQIENFTVDAVMQGVYYVATHDYVELLAAIYSINDFLHQKRQVRLVAVDSLAFPFRNGILNSLLRTRLLCDVMQELRMVAVKHNVAVLVTNQLTTKIGPGNSHLVPALGDSFGHYSNQRLMLGNLQRGRYAAVLFKSTRRQQSSAEFQILKSGIRDCSVSVK
ncbi:DNA repair protein RAD51 homolog 3-like isoform X2 [Zootermopsis nevadensis]|uniref:DNA repair protein RAD51 homolog 3-like isoform X2 n=1 Tax=Zootermopsis nevadensis TaxID=136037 RepID=UPI000B8E5AB6|nr:DNA repair protein RAD51 homolog 3-like isoform X2 [Zootermopsis nevadensis]